MQQNLANAISDDDYRLIETNQLGTPLRIYTLRYGLIRLWSSTIISMSIMGCLLLVALLTLTFLMGTCHPYGLDIWGCLVFYLLSW